MAAQVIDGKALADNIIRRIAHQVDERLAAGRRRPGLAVILVGSDPASRVYVRNKRKRCEEAGIVAKDYDLSAETSEEELLALVAQLNDDAEVDGILVQAPLPVHMDAQAVFESIAPHKDVDGFHPTNVGLLALRRPGLRPCTPRGIMTILHEYAVDAKRKHAVVVGASNHVGRPMMLELLLAGATVTCCHKFTRDLRQHVESAEILIVAAGKPELVPGRWVREDSVVIDVGINRSPEGKLIGDVEFAPAKDRARLITPVPGGVGPMTVATLLENTLLAADGIRDR